MNHFYVYEHWRPDTNQCFYVGKGQKSRSARISGRNPHHANIVAKLERLGLKPEIRIIASGMSEVAAFAMEKHRIARWTDIGVKLANKTIGGEGVSNPPPEVRAAIAKALTGNKHSLGQKRTPEQVAAIKARMTGNQFWLGKKLTDEHKANLSRAHRGRIPTRVCPIICLDDGAEFPSAAAAARHYGICSVGIVQLCNGYPHRKTAGGKKFAYINKEAA